MPSLSIDQAAFRRALLFLAAIGGPLCVGVWAQSPAGALVGAVTGLLLSFGDDDGPLTSRLLILTLSAVSLGLGGLIGILLRGFPWPLWVLFVLVTFATGFALRFGKGPAMAGRNCAMALVVTSGGPEFTLALLWYPLTALLIVVCARAIDHLVAGSLKQQVGGGGGPPRGGWARFALCYSGAATASLWLGVHLDPERALWVVVTTLVVMQSDARLSYVRIVHRIAGTVVGVVAAFALTSVLQSPWIIAVAVLGLAPLIPHHLQHRYWLHTALIALVVLLAYHLATSDPRILRGLFTERLEDVLLGAGLALIGTLLAFPRWVVEDG
jgi:uncharacterized membrane protein YccC